MTLHEMMNKILDKCELPTIKKYDVLKEAVEVYKPPAQVNCAIEEMSELIHALCRIIRLWAVPEDLFDEKKYNYALSDVVEEIADVIIMLQQLMIIFNQSSDVQRWVDYKIDRLEQRLLKEKVAKESEK